MPKTTSKRGGARPGTGGAMPGAGRPSNEASRRSIAAAARERGEQALDVLAKIMADKEAPAGARISAAAMLLDRGFGKPTEFKTDTPIDAVAELTDDEIASALAVLRAASGTDHKAGSGVAEAERPPVTH